jgi:hypothetical protein
MSMIVQLTSNKVRFVALNVYVRVLPRVFRDVMFRAVQLCGAVCEVPSCFIMPVV